MANLRKWSRTATGNASVAGGATTINWAEGQNPSTVNNSMREAMAQVRAIYRPGEWGWVEHSATASVASQTTIKIVEDVTAHYVQGRRIRLHGGSTTMYGDIVSSSFTAETTVTLKKDSGSLSASMSIAALSAVYPKNLNLGFKITKQVAETVNNSTVLQDDDELFFAVAANTDYEFEFTLFTSTNPAADFKLQLTGPAAPTFILTIASYYHPNGNTAAEVATAFSTVAIFTSDTGNDGMIKITGTLYNGANAGTVQLQWAQNTAFVGNTQVRKGSTIRYSVIP